MVGKIKMGRLYRVLKALGGIVRVVLVVGVVGVLLVFAGSEGIILLDRALVVFAIYAVIGNVLIVILARITSKVSRALIDILEHDCDPELYLEETEKITISRYWDADQSIAIVFYRILAFCYTNEKDEAERLFSKLELAYYKEKHAGPQAWIATLLFELSSLLNEENAFEKYRKVLLTFYAKNKTFGAMAKQARKYTEQMEKILQLKESNDVSALAAYYEDLFEKAPSNERRKRVEIAHNCIKYLVELDEIDQVCSLCEFIVAHGNKLPYVTEAKSMLHRYRNLPC